jgi:hypothetical protein
MRRGAPVRRDAAGGGRPTDQWDCLNGRVGGGGPGGRVRGGGGGGPRAGRGGGGVEPAFHFLGSERDRHLNYSTRRGGARAPLEVLCIFKHHLYNEAARRGAGVRSSGKCVRVHR